MLHDPRPATVRPGASPGRPVPCGRSFRDRLASRALLAAAILASGMLLCACIQPHAVFAPFSVITVLVDQPESQTRAGIRCTLSGTAKTAGDNDFAFTDTTGYASIRTQATGYHFVVARHQAYDITAGGLAANLTPGSPLQVFEQGRVVIPPAGETVDIDYFYPFTGVDSAPQRAPRRIAMIPKTPGKARFMFFAEDSDILKKTLQPDHQPQAIGKVSVTGDWNGWSLTEEDVDPENGARFLYDDGGFGSVPSGDTIGGDGAYTRVLDLPPGDHSYVFLINSVTLLTRDPYEENSKQIKATIRTPAGFPGNPNELEVREFRASTVLVTK